MIKIIFYTILFYSVYSREIAPRLLQNDGSRIPIVGLGVLRTYNETYQAVRDAIEVGYRHIDTSLNYGTEEEIGRALHDLFREGKVKREELYIVSKLEGNDHPRELVHRGINESLTNLGLDYLDLYLVTHHLAMSVLISQTRRRVWKMCIESDWLNQLEFQILMNLILSIF
jgi:diketogulonate reductase-like aldo/keto reductase